jgi:hypothetical protein
MSPNDARLQKLFVSCSNVTRCDNSTYTFLFYLEFCYDKIQAFNDRIASNAALVLNTKRAQFTTHQGWVNVLAILF